MLVLLAQCVSRTKTILDPTVAALTIDFMDVTYSGRADGLCNAVILSKEDGKLPSLQWAEEGARTRRGQASSDDSSCRIIVFVDEAVRGVRRRRQYREQLQGYESLLWTR